MRKNRQGGLQVFHGPLWAAGQVDDEGSSADACDGTGEKCRDVVQAMAGRRKSEEFWAGASARLPKA